MNWEKKGKILNGNKTKNWPFSYAAVPTAEIISNKMIILFSSRDSSNKSHIGCVEVNIEEPKKIIQFKRKPLLSPGKLGTFDDDGVMPSSIITIGKKKYLYYIGWNRRKTIPYHNSVGLAISNDGGKNYQRYSDGPIIERNMLEPFSNTNPFVLKEGNKWKIWYLSGVKWNAKNGLKQKYHIKYAESKDGINWIREGRVAIDFKNNQEWAISRPCVIKEKKMYKMWYSYRGNSNYRIGYAESKNGINWTRKDSDVGITISSSGWDSKTIEYPYVMKLKNNYLMLYCGNDFGKNGFGYAIS